MKTATLKQASKILSLVEQKETPCDQLQKLLSSGLFSDLLEADVDGVDRDAFRRLVGLKPLNPPLLEPLNTIKVPATEKFATRKKFVHDTRRKVPVKISYVGDNFSKWFLGKIEKPRPETHLRVMKLTRHLANGPILAELGNNAETTLAEIYALMKRQSNREGGVSFAIYANIFYVRDVNGELRAVSVSWDGIRWEVYASSVSSPNEWLDGSHVFSSNS